MGTMALQLVDPDVGAVISRALTAPEAASLAAVLAHNDLKSLAGLKSLSEKEWSELRVNSGLSIGKMGKVKREVEAAPDPIAPLAPSAMPQRLALVRSRGGVAACAASNQARTARSAAQSRGQHRCAVVLALRVCECGDAAVPTVCVCSHCCVLR